MQDSRFKFKSVIDKEHDAFVEVLYEISPVCETQIQTIQPPLAYTKSLHSVMIPSAGLLIKVHYCVSFFAVFHVFR